MTPSYQLTKYNIGSKREFWALSWPLMLGMISSTMMMFVDRLFLANYDSMSLNGAVVGCMACFMFMVIPNSIAAIAEVLVGRLNGDNRKEEIGAATWQMIWFSVAMIPLFWFFSWIMPDLLFYQSPNFVHETTFFQIMMYVAPSVCITIALSGFFIGIGNVKIVTFAALLGNFLNIILDYFFIFGWGPIPEMGVAGAAFATGTSQIIQMLVLFYVFWFKNNKEYSTRKLVFHKPFLMEGLKIGVPSSVGHMMEVVAHFLFFRIVMSVGPEQMTIVAIVQSYYILACFIVDAQSKAASAIVSNLLGANYLKPLKKVLQSAATLHILYTLILYGCVFLFPDFFFKLFSSSDQITMLSDPVMSQTFFMAFTFMCLFFLTDGLSWILIGFLTSAGDTKYILYVSVFVHWVAYLLPTAWFVGWGKGGADVAWSIIAGMSILNFGFYFWRYLSGKWLSSFQPTSVELTAA